MVNAWSLLFDELNMTEHSTHYYDYTRNDVNRKNPFKEDVIKLDGYSVNSASHDNFWKEDSFSITDDSITSSDTINFSSIDFGAAQEVPITYGCDDVISFDLTMDEKNKLNRYKYNEDVILKELKDYITGTYNQHYSAGDDKIQTLDLIEACGDGESFCRSNILKYASRYDKKGTARRDIMKILHYAVLLMHFNDKNAQRETYPQ